MRCTTSQNRSLGLAHVKWKNYHGNTGSISYSECRSRAMENAVYLAYVNRVGIEDGLQFWGGSRVVSPSGSILAQCKYDEEEFQPCEIDLDEVARSRAFIPTIKDLEPGLFDLLRTKSREA